MTSTEQALAKHLAEFDGPSGPPHSPYHSSILAKAILADPQAHVDALLAAGVLEIAWPDDTNKTYRVVQPEPHVHNWSVIWVSSAKRASTPESLELDPVSLRCVGCDLRVPIDVPS